MSLLCGHPGCTAEARPSTGRGFAPKYCAAHTGRRAEAERHPAPAIGVLMAHIQHYAEGAGINWPLFAEGLEALKRRFETDNAIVALERLFIELEQDGLALLAKRRRR